MTFRRKSGSGSLLVTLVVLGVAAYFVRRPLLRTLGDFVIDEDSPQKSDAVLILNGAFPRGILEAADLYAEGKAPLVYLFRERLPDGFDELLRRGVKANELTDTQAAYLQEMRLPADALRIVDGRHETTRQEIETLARILQKAETIGSVIVIARRPQTRRTKRLLRELLPPGIRFYVVAPRTDPIRHDNYWHDSWHLKDVALEYLKFLYEGLAIVSPITPR